MEVTLKPVDPEILSFVAEIVVDCPPVTPVAKPTELIVAAVVFEDAQVTELVIFEVVPSLNVPVAVN
jgi:hypothetical protein